MSDLYYRNAQIVAMRQRGDKYREIGERFGLSAQRVSLIADEWNKSERARLKGIWAGLNIAPIALQTLKDIAE